MYATVIVIHVIISLFLIAVILLQAGKGGGLSDTFGGSQMPYKTYSCVRHRLYSYLYYAGSFVKPSSQVYCG
jgi:hypothetical protein